MRPNKSSASQRFQECKPGTSIDASQNLYDVVIIGAGASGIMCAWEAAKRNRKVLVLDHSRKICGKVLISGGGKCNFTNLHMDYKHYISQNPDFCRSALSRFTPENFISWMKKQGIAYTEREDGQLFCMRSASDIVQAFLQECQRLGVTIHTDCFIENVDKIEPPSKISDGREDDISHPRFFLSCDKNRYTAHSLVIATGGLSYPSVGASGWGYELAKKLGISVTELRPGLTPFLFSSHDKESLGVLSGISLDAEVSCHGKSFSGNVLFTHRGMSGPAILQISLYWKHGDSIVLNVLPFVNSYEFLLSQRKEKKFIYNVLDRLLPLRFAKVWCERYHYTKPICQHSEKELQNMAENLHSWKIKPQGTEGYQIAEVTLGGVSTERISSKTMESQQVPGLYFIGEVLDVTGELGGYNLHWAWASGYAAGAFV